MEKYKLSNKSEKLLGEFNVYESVVIPEEFNLPLQEEVGNVLLNCRSPKGEVYISAVDSEDLRQLFGYIDSTTNEISVTRIEAEGELLYDNEEENKIKADNYGEEYIYPSGWKVVL